MSTLSIVTVYTIVLFLVYTNFYPSIQIHKHYSYIPLIQIHKHYAYIP